VSPGLTRDLQQATAEAPSLTAEETSQLLAAAQAPNANEDGLKDNKTTGVLL